MSENSQETEVATADAKDAEAQVELDLTEGLLQQFRHRISENPTASFNSWGLGLFHSLEDDLTYELLKSEFGRQPTDTLDFYNLGVSHARHEKYKDAIKAFDKALSTDPEFYEAYFNRALAIEKTGDTAGAKKAWDEVLTRTQDEEEAEALREHIAQL